MKMKWYLKYNGVHTDEEGNKVFRFKVHWLWIVWIRTRTFFLYYFTPVGIMRDFANEHPSEFDKICKELYIDKVVKWLHRILK